MIFTNEKNISLSMAVFLANDDYDYNPDPNHISVTTLIKPLRQIILGKRVTGSNESIDISERIPSVVGSAIHNGVEHAWIEKYKENLSKLGYPKKVIDKIRINPTELDEDDIPIYLEQRSSKIVDGIAISGKYDLVIEGRVEDVKSTGVFSYMSKSNDHKYILQGSLYRWLNPEIITQDYMAIQFVFTDWSKLRATIEKDKGYPPTRVLEHPLKLIGLSETDKWVKNKIKDIKQNLDTPETELPECSDQDLWRGKTLWKYYKNPQKTSRSTKNYNSQAEAGLRLAQEGVGIVLEAKAEVGACKYCNAFSACSQKDRLIADGSLKI